MVIITGLGNPGQKYAGTRHNIGFSAVTALADKNDILLRTREHKALTGKGVIAGKKVLLAQPQTYMNLSGESVRELTDYYKIDVSSELIVISDDIDLPTGKIRIRAHGSAGGHNGLKNIIEKLGQSDFIRIRVGVGKKPEGKDLVTHVLSTFPRAEEETVRQALFTVTEVCEVILAEGVDRAMNRYNGKG